MRSCPVCTSCRRVEIETALFRVHSDDGPEALENISKAFDIDVPALQEHMLFHAATKPVVDLYIGSADGLRRTVQTIADVNQLLNGPKDDGLSGLGALAKALDMSRQMVATPQEPAPLGQFNNPEGVNEP